MLPIFSNDKISNSTLINFILFQFSYQVVLCLTTVKYPITFPYSSHLNAVIPCAPSSVNLILVACSFWNSLRAACRSG